MRWINLNREKPTKGKRAKSVRKRPMPRWTRRSLRALGVAVIFALALGGRHGSGSRDGSATQCIPLGNRRQHVWAMRACG